MTSTTAQSVAEKMIEEIDVEEVYGKSPMAQYTFRDDTLSERHENLLERFPAKDISDIRKLEKTLDTYEHSDIPMEEVSEVCLENDIVSSEVLLMDVMFKNELKTASRNGITLLNIDGSLEIRNDEEKFLSPDEVDLFKGYLVGEDDDMPPEFQGYDIARGPTTTSGGINTTKSGGFQGTVKDVTISHEAGRPVKYKREVQI